MLSPPEEKRSIMSARARRRLINSALTEHPVAQETMRTYEAVLLFSRNMVQWLDAEGLSEEANLVKSVKPVILNQVNEFYINFFFCILLVFIDLRLLTIFFINTHSSETNRHGNSYINMHTHLSSS